jgi:hypothetical protein
VWNTHGEEGEREREREEEFLSCGKEMGETLKGERKYILRINNGL